MSRGKWKNLYFSNDVLKKAIILKSYKELKGKNKIIFKKSTAIPKLFLNKNFNIFKGCFFRNIQINQYVIGYKFGEFSFTRKPFKYIIKKKK